MLSLDSLKSTDSSSLYVINGSSFRGSPGGVGGVITGWGVGVGSISCDMLVVPYCFTAAGVYELNVAPFSKSQSDVAAISDW